MFRVERGRAEEGNVGETSRLECAVDLRMLRESGRKAPHTRTCMNAPADCRRCGVCCFSSTETYVRMTGEDWARLGESAETVAQFVGNRAFMRMREGRCAALEVRVDGATGARDFFCAIYERRPQVCRDLARGSPECEGERARKAAG